MRSPRRKAFLSRGDHGGRIYWNIRSSEKPRQAVLVRLGRCPEDPKRREAFLVRVRIALRRYGIMRDIQPMKSRR